MIKKLSQRIFLLIMIPLSVIILGIIILFAFLNYDNTINMSTSMMNRFIDEKPKRNLGNREEEYKTNPKDNIEV